MTQPVAIEFGTENLAGLVFIPDARLRVKVGGLGCQHLGRACGERDHGHAGGQGV